MESLEALNNDKLIIALISAFVGLLFAQLAIYIKYQYNKRRLKTALLKELQDIDQSLESAIGICRRKIMMNVKHLHEGSMPVAIGTYIFDSYYKEISIDISSTQRRSYQLIYHHIRSINDAIQYLTDKNNEASEAHFLKPEALDSKFRCLWFDRLASLYENMCVVRWHIAHHIANKKNPELPYKGPIYDDFISLENDIQTEIAKLIKEAEAMSVKDFELRKVRL